MLSFVSFTFPIQSNLMLYLISGKSTLLNSLLGEQRVIAGPTAGLTRDSIAVEWMFRDRTFRLVDTAGLTRLQTNKDLLAGIKEQRKVAMIEKVGRDVNVKIVLPGIQTLDPEQDPSQWSAQISEYALLSALNACKLSQVVMLVVESDQGKFSKVDLQLARHCLNEGRGVFIAANKCDLLSDKGVSIAEFEKQVSEHTAEYFREFGDIPVVVCSGENNKNLRRLLNTAIEVHDSWSRRISTWVLNKWLKELMVTAPTARAGDKAVHIKYVTQVKARPPTFALFSNVTELPVFLERFLRSRLQQEFRLKGVPIRFIVKKSEGNEVKKHLLKQGKHTRRGTGLGEAKGRVGPKRDETRSLRKVVDNTDERRRRDTRLSRKRSV
jgi:GTPase